MWRTEKLTIGVVGIAFALSGTAALIDQVVWQRILFAGMGVDTASITLIVACFMLGLGSGALFGGWLADHFPTRALMIFCLAEVGVGIFSWFSPDLLRALSDALLYASPLWLAVANFSVLLLPTSMMGATLPVLISYLTRQWHHVGSATGHLYAVNTLGATLGAWLGGFVLFHHMTLDAAVKLAAGLNFLAAGAVALVGTVWIKKGKS